MSIWDRFRRKQPADKLDGYTPTPTSPGDPWAAPDITEQVSRRADASRMDAEAYDGFRNELTGIGSWSRDKTMGGQRGGPTFDVRLMSGVECQNLWRGSDLGGRIVETIPDEMTREGFDVSVQPTEEDDEKEDAFPPTGAPAAPSTPSAPRALPEVDDEGEEIAEAVESELERLRVDEVFWEALCYERAYGGAVVLIGCDDGMPLDQPLDVDRVEEVSHLTAFRGGWDGEVVAWSYYSDPRQPNYGMPEVYMVRNMGVPVARVPAPGGKLAPEPVLPRATDQSYGNLVFWVHESRFLVFPGVAVSRTVRTQMRGWGDSVFVRCSQVLSEYDQTWGGVANLMTDFSQGVLKVKGLLAMMGKPGAKTSSVGLLQRATALNLTRSISRMMLVDAEGEEFSRDTASLAGIADVLAQFALRLAAAADMPVDLLMGQSAAGGLNKGDATIRFFYDRVKAKQKKRLVPPLKKLIRLLFAVGDGPTEGVEPERWDAVPRPLFQETPAERATRMYTVAQADSLYVTMQAALPEEVAATRFAGSGDSNDGPIILDLEGRAEMAEQDERDRAAQAAQMAKQQEVELAKAKALQVAPAAEASGEGEPVEKPVEEEGTAK